MPYVYILRCRDGSLYTGVTTNLERRLAEHAAGRGARYTRGRRPVALAWRRRAATWSQALKEEYRIKRLPRAEKLALVAECPRTRRAAGRAI